MLMTFHSQLSQLELQLLGIFSKKYLLANACQISSIWVQNWSRYTYVHQIRFNKTSMKKASQEKVANVIWAERAPKSRKQGWQRM